MVPTQVLVLNLIGPFKTHILSLSQEEILANEETEAQRSQFLNQDHTALSSEVGFKCNQSALSLWALTYAVQALQGSHCYHVFSINNHEELIIVTITLQQHDEACTIIVPHLNQGTERLSNLPLVTQLRRGEPRI